MNGQDVLKVVGLLLIALSLFGLAMTGVLDMKNHDYFAAILCAGVAILGGGYLVRWATKEDKQ